MEKHGTPGIHRYSRRHSLLESMSSEKPSISCLPSGRPVTSCQYSTWKMLQSHHKTYLGDLASTGLVGFGDGLESCQHGI